MTLASSPRRFRTLAALASTAALLALGGGCAGGGEIDSSGEDTASADEALCPGGHTTKGIDVSYFQGTVNWHAAKTSGVEFGIARVADGDGFVDPKFAQNWHGMKAAGVLRGAYQFFRPEQDPIQQADVLISHIKSAGGLEDGDLPPTIDVEVTDGVSHATIAGRLSRWLKHVEDKLHRTPMIYVSPGFWSGIGSPGGFSHYPLWVANWGVSCPSVPSGFHGFAFWQYADDAHAGGVSGRVDGDKFNGSLADLKKFAGVKEAPSGPTIEEEEATLQVAELDDNGTTDLDGDGKADACSFNHEGIHCYLSNGHGFDTHAINGPRLEGDQWTKPSHFATLRFADINGDGKADVCIRGEKGMRCWKSTGTGFGAEIDTGLLSDDSGWTDQKNWETIRMADVNGDGKADLCARNNDEFRCWLSNGHGFDSPPISGPSWGEKNGWGAIANSGTIRMADINGDGKADVCARSNKTITCYLSNGHGFPTHVDGPDLQEPGWSDPDNWSTLRFGDIDGDGKADLCGRADDGFKCWKSNGHGFGGTIHGPELSSDRGWADHDNYSTIRLADIDGDGKADLCARSNHGVKCWRSNGNGFGAGVESGALSDAHGGDKVSHYRTLRFADVNGDGKQDLCFRNGDGLHCWLSNGHGFPTVVDGPGWSDDNGWGKERFYTTITVR